MNTHVFQPSRWVKRFCVEQHGRAISLFVCADDCNHRCELPRNISSELRQRARKIPDGLVARRSTSYSDHLRTEILKTFGKKEKYRFEQYHLQYPALGFLTKTHTHTHIFDMRAALPIFLPCDIFQCVSPACNFDTQTYRKPTILDCDLAILSLYKRNLGYRKVRTSKLLRTKQKAKLLPP